MGWPGAFTNFTPTTTLPSPNPPTCQAHLTSPSEQPPPSRSRLVAASSVGAATTSASWASESRLSRLGIHRWMWTLEQVEISLSLIALCCSLLSSLCSIMMPLTHSGLSIIRSQSPTHQPNSAVCKALWLESSCHGFESAFSLSNDCTSLRLAIFTRPKPAHTRAQDRHTHTQARTRTQHTHYLRTVSTYGKSTKLFVCVCDPQESLPSPST